MNEAAAAEIEFRGVSHSFRETGRVLERLDFKIPAGQFVTLLGPSGCGKSTILRLIAGFEPPSEGVVDANQNVGATNFERGIVFQDAHLLPWRTALQNAVLPLEFRDQAEPAEEARKALTQIGLADALDKYPNQLSGGMKMRVSVARALVGEPRLLLLDEPFAALDDLTRHKLQEDLSQLARQKKVTVIFVTHSVTEAVFLSDRILRFSPRPARVMEDVAIDLGARTAETRFTPEYARKVAELSRSLEAHV